MKDSVVWRVCFWRYENNVIEPRITTSRIHISKFNEEMKTGSLGHALGTALYHKEYPWTARNYKRFRDAIGADWTLSNEDHRLDRGSRAWGTCYLSPEIDEIQEATIHKNKES